MRDGMIAPMQLTLLGTGAAGGIPLWGCTCAACCSARDEPARRRRPASAALTHAGRTFLIDAGLGDLEQRYPDGVNGFLLTHFHADHVQGLFHLRWGPGAPVPVWCPADSEGCADLFKHPGCLRFQPQAPFTVVDLGEGLTATALPLAHGKPTFGWLFADGQRRIAYCTDTRGFPPATAQALRDAACTAIVLDSTYASDHPAPTGHNHVALAVDLLVASATTRGVLTHIGHECQRAIDERRENIPDHIVVANDGLVI